MSEAKEITLCQWCGKPPLEPTAPNADKAATDNELAVARIVRRALEAKNISVDDNVNAALSEWKQHLSKQAEDRLEAETPESASCNRSVQGQGE